MIAGQAKQSGMGQNQQSASERSSAMRALEKLIDYARVEAEVQRLPMLSYLLNIAYEELMQNLLKEHNEEQLIVLCDEQDEKITSH